MIKDCIDYHDSKSHPPATVNEFRDFKRFENIQLMFTLVFIVTPDTQNTEGWFQA